MGKTLLSRIEQGLTTVSDAQAVLRIIAMAEAFETALRQIAIKGSTEDAMLASRVIALYDHESSSPFSD
jgi:hypothetical protein